MAESVKPPLPECLPSSSIASAWAPLQEPLFRSLWVAAVISYTGTWMQNVGAGWMMTQLTMSPFMVGLVQAATTLPVFLVMLPAGALADMVDRRRFLLLTQGWMVLAAGALGVLTLLHQVTPWVLLIFTFVLGFGAVMNDPAWQAITPEVVSPACHTPAVALNSIGFNVARSVGPAIGGAIVAVAGSGTAFLLNAASFFGVIFFLYRWKRPQHEHLEKSQFIDALRDGVRHVTETRSVQAVLVRAGTFSLAASALLALLPLLAQPHGASGYGMLLGAFGLGALLGGVLLPTARGRWSVDGLVAGAIVVFALMTFAAGHVQGFSWLVLVMAITGMAWIGILACLNVAAQTMSPPRLRARALSMYLLVFQGGMAIGSAAWGALAQRIGVPSALFCSALALVVGVLVVRKYRLTARELELSPLIVRE